MSTRDDKELYQTLGALLESSKDVKDELKFIHKAIVEDRADMKALDLRLQKADDALDERLQSVEKKQYAIWVVATVVWAAIVALFNKYG